MLPVFNTFPVQALQPLQPSETLFRLSVQNTALSLTVHLIFQNVLSLYVAGSMLGCSIGLLVKKSMSRYHLGDRSFQILFKYERYMPLMKIACLILAIFINIWNTAAALVLSVGTGIWTGCTFEMKQACEHFV